MLRNIKGSNLNTNIDHLHKQQIQSDSEGSFEEDYGDVDENIVNNKA